MKKLLLIMTIVIFSKNGLTEEKKPDYGKIAIEGIITGIKEPFKHMPKAIEIISNKINESPEKKTWKKSVICNEKGKECKTRYSE